MGKGVHFPCVFLMDKNGKGFGEEDEDEDTAAGEEEMKLKIVGGVERKLMVMGEVVRVREVKIAGEVKIRSGVS